MTDLCPWWYLLHTSCELALAPAPGGATSEEVDLWLP